MTRRFSNAHLADCPGGQCSALGQNLGRRNPGAFEVFIPRGYEPNYPYPLIVWFHHSGGNERNVHQILPQVSERNALGLALRGERVRRSGGFDWLGGHRPRRRQRLLAALRQLRSEYHIHTERIILAGQNSGAEAAANLFWQNPDWYGGLALFDLPWKSLPSNLGRRDELRGKPLLYDQPLGQMGAGREVAGQLRALGLEVTFQHARTGPLLRETCRTLDRWILAAVCGVPA